MVQKYRDSLKKEAQPAMTTVKDTQGFQSVTLPFETIVPTIGGSTSCGNQSNALLTQMVEAFSSEQIRDRKSTRLNSSHRNTSRMPSSA